MRLQPTREPGSICYPKELRSVELRLCVDSLDQAKSGSLMNMKTNVNTNNTIVAFTSFVKNTVRDIAGERIQYTSRAFGIPVLHVIVVYLLDNRDLDIH
jgi:hypothetical protein